MRTALYPGTFDPVTNGHIDLIQRSAKLFDQLIVAVAINRRKQPLFTVEERLAMLEVVLPPLPNVRLDHFEGLLVDFAKKQGVDAVIRGIRAVSDYEFEFQMALMNRNLAPNLETVFMMPSQEYTYLSSSMVREVSSLGGDISTLVPSYVLAQLQTKFAEKKS
ncbi:MAG: pantetheine-phosphate adenylyltransferase [Gemmatimonadetes bacterium]|nr:MAG: pantetheine-phosphate adenylyltransferase [Gemmatimonadota bacterium]